MATPIRRFRAEDSLWEPAQAKTAAEGITVTDVLRDALERYNDGISEQRPNSTVYVVRSRRQLDKRTRSAWSYSPPLPEAEAKRMFTQMKRAAAKSTDGSEVQLIRRADYVVEQTA
jgi:hypothetical protein